MIIDKIIAVNKLACEHILDLEKAIKDAVINDAKDKAQFGNLCVALRGFRMVADATEAILNNENVLKTKDGDFYKKIEPEEEKATDDNAKP